MKLKKDEFKWLVGVRPKTFRRMVKVVGEAEDQQKKAGRPSKLSIEEQVLLSLEVDVGESRIERPKKSSGTAIQARKSDIPSRLRS